MTKVVISNPVVIDILHSVSFRLSDGPRSVKYLLLIFLYTFIINLAPTHLYAQSAQEWFDKGVEAFRWNNDEQTIEYFSKAMELEPGSSQYLFYLGLTLHRAGRYDEAEKYYGKSLASGGQKAQILLNRGNLRWARGNVDGALEDYDTVIESSGGMASAALLNRANLYLKQGNLGNVVEDYTAYLKKEPYAPDRDNIERILHLIQQRLVEEARIAKEAAKREALMDQLYKSINEDVQETKDKSAGYEKLLEELEDSELEE